MSYVSIRDILSSAAQIVGEGHCKMLSYEVKADKSLCSEIDQKVSLATKAILQKSGFFDDPRNMYLDEEDASSATLDQIKNANEVVIIDPIDGSGALLEGRSEYCIMVAHFKNNNGVLTAIQSGVYAPRTFETVIMDVDGKVTVTETISTGLNTTKNITRAGEDAVSKLNSGNMLLDYRYEQKFTWLAMKSLKVHLNPSGRNVLDIAMNRGRGFVFVYKPWDLCAMPIAHALGCKTYLLSENGQSYTATEVNHLDVNWFDYDADKNEFGKMKQPLLFCREENLAFILENLQKAWFEKRSPLLRASFLFMVILTAATMLGQTHPSVF